MTDRFAEQKAVVAAAVPQLAGQDVTWRQLFGGLAHVTYVAETAGGETCVVKFLTQEMDDFGLMIPIPQLLTNTEAAGVSGIGSKVLLAMPEVPALVLEYIDGSTMTTAELSEPANIPRIGRAIRDLHAGTPPMANTIDIFRFLEDYLGLVDEHTLDTPEGMLDRLPTMRRIQEALQHNALPLVPSNNDLLAKNVMDDGNVRLIDYDFSGMNDPMFDVGDVAMEGDYSPEQVAQICAAYWGRHDPVQYARARLFGIIAQYTWSLLFVGMDRLLSDSPDESFDYWKEAVDRWEWTKAKLDHADFESVVAAASA